MGENYACDSYDFDIFTDSALGFSHNLIKSGNLINTRNKNGWSPLMYACSGGHIETIQYLLHQGALTGQQGGSYNRSPLMIAVGTGDLNTVKAVYQFRDLELIDSRGWTALFYAVFFGREVTVHYLLSNGAQINRQDNRGQNLALLAVKSGIESLVEIFVKRGAEMAVTSKDMESAISVARNSKSPQIKSMISNALSPSLRSHFGLGKRKTLVYSPSKMAMEKENLSPVRAGSSMKKAFLSPQTPRHENHSLIGRKSLDPAETWTLNNIQEQERQPGAVLEFLKQLKLEKYWPIFRDEEVDFETLLTFGDSNLQELGIKLYGPRKKILAALQIYKDTYPNTNMALKAIKSIYL